MAVLAVSVLALSLYHVLNHPGMSLAFPLSLALLYPGDRGPSPLGAAVVGRPARRGLVYRVLLVSRAMMKLGVHDRAQLVVLAYETGLVAPRRA